MLANVFGAYSSPASPERCMKSHRKCGSPYRTPEKKTHRGSANTSPSTGSLAENLSNTDGVSRRLLGQFYDIDPAIIKRLLGLKYQEKYDELFAALERDVKKYNENFEALQKLDSSGVELTALGEGDTIERKLFSCYHTGCASHVTAAMKSCINLLNDVKEESIAEDAPERAFAELFMRLYRVIILYKYEKQNDSQGNKSTGSTALANLQSKITNDSDKIKGDFKRILTGCTRFFSLDNNNSRTSQGSFALLGSNDSGPIQDNLFLAKYFLNRDGRFNSPHKTLVLDQPDVNAGFSNQEFGVTVIPQDDCSDILYQTNYHDHLFAVMALDQMPVGQLKGFSGDKGLVCSRTTKISGQPDCYYRVIPVTEHNEKLHEMKLTVWDAYPARCEDKNQYIIMFDNSSMPFCETICTLRKKLLIDLQGKIAENGCIYADVTVDNIGMVDDAVRIRDDDTLKQTDHLSDDFQHDFPRSTYAGADRSGYSSYLENDKHADHPKSEYIKISKIISVVQSVLTIYNIQSGHETARLYDMLFAQMYERLRSDLHWVNEQFIKPAELIGQLCLDINRFYGISGESSTADALNEIEKFHFLEMKQYYEKKEGCSEFTLIAGDAECDSEILQALRGNNISRDSLSVGERYVIRDGNAEFWSDHARNNSDTAEKFTSCRSYIASLPGNNNNRGLVTPRRSPSDPSDRATPPNVPQGSVLVVNIDDFYSEGLLNLQFINRLRSEQKGKSTRIVLFANLSLEQVSELAQSDNNDITISDLLTLLDEIFDVKIDHVQLPASAAYEKSRNLKFGDYFEKEFKENQASIVQWCHDQENPVNTIFKNRNGAIVNTEASAEEMIDHDNEWSQNLNPYPDSMNQIHAYIIDHFSDFKVKEFDGNSDDMPRLHHDPDDKNPFQEGEGQSNKPWREYQQNYKISDYIINAKNRDVLINLFFTNHTARAAALALSRIDCNDSRIRIRIYKKLLPCLDREDGDIADEINNVERIVKESLGADWNSFEKIWSSEKLNLLKHNRALSIKKIEEHPCLKENQSTQDLLDVAKKLDSFLRSSEVCVDNAYWNISNDFMCQLSVDLANCFDPKETTGSIDKLKDQLNGCFSCDISPMMGGCSPLKMTGSASLRSAHDVVKGYSDYQKAGLRRYQSYCKTRNLSRHEYYHEGQNLITFKNYFARNAAKELFAYIGYRTSHRYDSTLLCSHGSHKRFYDVGYDDSLQSKKQNLVCECLFALENFDENSSADAVTQCLFNFINNEIVDRREAPFLNTLFGGCIGQKTRLRQCFENIIGETGVDGDQKALRAAAQYFIVDHV